jgi:hypothetical protein
MDLMRCPECGKYVSAQAEVCPQCDCPLDSIIPSKLVGAPPPPGSLPIKDLPSAPASQPVQTAVASPSRPPPVWFVGLIALLLPGLGSVLTKGWRARKVVFFMLFPFIPIAFVFFGPVWKEVLFPDSPQSDKGLLPFLGCCVLTQAVSLVVALVDLRTERSKKAL